MKRRATVLSSRRILIVAVVFGLFVVFDIALFGWLVFDSLSQREIEKALLEVQQEAEPLAQALAEQAEKLGQQDLWVVVSVAQETQKYIDAVLQEREVMQRIEIRDRDGNLVWQKTKTTGDPQEGPRVEIQGSENVELPNPLSLPTEQEVAIGDLGSLVVGLSEDELRQRVVGLRGDLIRQVLLIGMLTVTLLAAALAAIWVLVKRGRELEEQAMEAERLAYVGTLASGLAHEIRNPLNSLHLNMQMLEEDFCDQSSSGSQMRLLSITRSEIGRLERLVTDFLSYAKPRPPELEVATARELFERVIEVLAGEIQARRARVEIDDRSQEAQVRVDRGQMAQLLLNLTQNALAATEESRWRPRILLRARHVDDEVWLEVIDNGSGIAVEDREKIFDLFYSTRKGGTGLGLAIVERIAKAHRAEIEVESESGEGTTVRLRLAAVEPRPVSFDRAPLETAAVDV